MSNKFSIKTASLFASLGVVAAFALVSPIQEANAGDDKVDCGKLAKANVQKFCEKVGGKKGAIKKVMKEAEKDYKAKVGDIGCKSCHTESNGGPLDEKKTAELWPKYSTSFDTAVAAYKPKD